MIMCPHGFQKFVCKQLQYFIYRVQLNHVLGDGGGRIGDFLFSALHVERVMDKLGLKFV